MRVRGSVKEAEDCYHELGGKVIISLHGRNDRNRCGIDAESIYRGRERTSRGRGRGKGMEQGRKGRYVEQWYWKAGE